MRKIIIDCDPGHDDILASLVAMDHPEELEILGFTTVCGNNLVDKVTANLCKVLTVLGKSYPVAVGYNEPIRRQAEPQSAHGSTGLDGPVLPDSMISPIEDHAIEFIKKCALENDRITLVGIGPLTNIAMFLKTWPQLKEKIECIAIMGGSSQSGNILPRAEFNIYADPEAAKIVFNSGVEVMMAGLEICSQCRIYHTDLDCINQNSRAGKMVYDILYFFSLYSRKRNIPYSTVFDTVPIVYLLHPEYFESQNCKVDVETEGDLCRGMTVVTADPNGHTKELVHADMKKYNEFMLDLLKRF